VNNGTFQIVQVTSATTCQIANNAPGLSGDTFNWSISAYPFIAPGLVWGAPGQVFGEGDLGLPAPDQGSLQGGMWAPTVAGSPLPVVSWGLSCPESLIDTIRLLLARWKGAGTWYSHIVVAFDGAVGAQGAAFSPNSTPGSGNPNGTFGPEGQNSAGVWVPTRLVSSYSNAWCGGTTRWPNGGAAVT
jgi:hypothetical protein